MSEINPYSEICICDPFGAQVIGCLATFHHVEQDVEEDELPRPTNPGQEYGDFVVISIPSVEAQHADQAEGLLRDISDEIRIQTPHRTDQTQHEPTTGQHRIGHAENTLYSNTPAPQNSAGRRRVQHNYREHIQPSTEDESSQHPRSSRPHSRTDSNSRNSERKLNLGQIVQDLNLAGGEDSSLAEHGKEQLMQLASGEIVEMEVYNDLDPVLHIQSWSRVSYRCQ